MSNRKNPGFQVGERVAYANAFLRSTGMFTGWAPFARGKVLSTSPFGGRDLVLVEWDDTPSPCSVLDCNLVRVADLPKELA